MTKTLPAGRQAREQILNNVTGITASLKDLSLSIHSQPETGYDEHHAMREIVDRLSEAGFSINTGAAGLATAFTARKRSSRRGPVIAFLCEYDALPELGHACGHNLIAAAGCGAGLLLGSVIDELGGEVRVIGCPAEEGAVTDAGGKVRLIEGGVFAGIDAALMVHPSAHTIVHTSSAAREAVEFTYHGRAAHAAGAPEEGINALDAVIQLFVTVNALRAHLPDGSRVHGFIPHGGVAANIIPELAIARLYVRARNPAQLEQVLARVMACARAAETATGARLEHRTYANRYLNMVTNRPLADRLADNLNEVGLSVEQTLLQGGGSTDMGNVSHVVPSVHAFFEIGASLHGHTREFAQACAGASAQQRMVRAAAALALTGADLISCRHLMRDVRTTFARRRRELET